MYQVANYIDGEWFSGNDFTAVNPSTGEEYCKCPQSSPFTAETAVKAARSAFPSWRSMSRIARADLFDNLAQLLKRDHEQLKEAISIETGKNLNESHAEVIEALHMCQFAAATGRQSYGEVFGSELATKDAYVIRKPKGVVAIISPWNFPMAIGSFWSAAPSLVEGNTVVHKPSELTPMINDMVARLYDEAGFPKGVYNVIHGDGVTGAALVRSNVETILFTGSAEVGKDIKKHCAEEWKTCCCECGSKSAVIVCEDADLKLAVDVSVASMLKLSGQRCVSSGRILIEEKVFNVFRDMFVEKVREAKSVDPFEYKDWTNSFTYGPMISMEQKKKVMGYNQLVKEDHDTQILVEEFGVDLDNQFLGPFVYQCEWSDRPFLKEEVFGPHCALVPFKGVDDAIRIYNDTPYGLALGVVSEDFRKHRRFAQECDTGMLYINGGSIAAESHLPFSSWKRSGWGASAAATWKAVTHSMAITTNFEEGKLQFAQGMK